MLWVWIMFSSLDLVRRNINRAVSDNMVCYVDWRENEELLYPLPGEKLTGRFSLTIWESIPSRFSVLRRERILYLLTQVKVIITPVKPFTLSHSLSQNSLAGF